PRGVATLATPSNGAIAANAPVPVVQMPANGTGIDYVAPHPTAVVGTPPMNRTALPAGTGSAFAEVGSDGGGSNTSPVQYFSCADGNMTASDDLWYFGGGTIANYPTTITLTVSNIPAEATSITWTVTDGYDKANFVSGTE